LEYLELTNFKSLISIIGDKAQYTSKGDPMSSLNQKSWMSDSTLDLFIKHHEESEEFWTQVNKMAEEYELPTDYILMEFV